MSSRQVALGVRQTPFLDWPAADISQSESSYLSSILEASDADVILAAVS